MADQVETWPLVEVDASSLPVRKAQGLIGDALGAAIERGQPFAAIVRMPSEALRDRTLPGVADRIRILKRLRGGLSARCVGLAFVVSAEAQRHNAKAIRAADKMWGCPTLAVDDHAAARAWALDRLHGNEPATGGA